MTLEKKVALVIKELFSWNGQIKSMLIESDPLRDKAYDFNHKEALRALKDFVKKWG